MRRGISKRDVTSVETMVLPPWKNARSLIDPTLSDVPKENLSPSVPTVLKQGVNGRQYDFIVIDYAIRLYVLISLHQSPVAQPELW